MKFGLYCYSIYIIHQPLLNAIDPYKHKFFEILKIENQIVEIKFLVYFPVVCLLLYCIGKISFNLIEKPSIIIGKKVISKFILR
jgi:peptidoglycan/LPS O-acetylase OafA/YrhL